MVLYNVMTCVHVWLSVSDCVHRQNCLEEYGIKVLLQKLEKTNHHQLQQQWVDASPCRWQVNYSLYQKMPYMYIALYNAFLHLSHNVINFVLHSFICSVRNALDQFISNTLWTLLQFSSYSLCPLISPIITLAMYCLLLAPCRTCRLWMWIATFKPSLLAAGVARTIAELEVCGSWRCMLNT